MYGGHALISRVSPVIFLSGPINCEVDIDRFLRVESAQRFNGTWPLSKCGSDLIIDIAAQLTKNVSAIGSGQVRTYLERRLVLELNYCAMQRVPSLINYDTLHRTNSRLCGSQWLEHDGDDEEAAHCPH